MYFHVKLRKIIGKDIIFYNFYDTMRLVYTLNHTILTSKPYNQKKIKCPVFSRDNKLLYETLISTAEQHSYMS